MSDQKPPWPDINIVSGHIIIVADPLHNVHMYVPIVQYTSLKCHQNSYKHTKCYCIVLAGCPSVRVSCDSRSLIINKPAVCSKLIKRCKELLWLSHQTLFIVTRQCTELLTIHIHKFCQRFMFSFTLILHHQQWPGPVQVVVCMCELMWHCWLVLLGWFGIISAAPMYNHSNHMTS